MTLIHLFLSALVGLGGMGAVVSFQHASDLLNGLHLFTHVSVSDEVHANEPTPTVSPTVTPTPTVTVVDPTISPTPTPTIDPTASPSLLRIHRLDDDELDDVDDDKDFEDHRGVGILGEIRGLFGNHANRGLHEGLERKSGLDSDHD